MKKITGALERLRAKARGIIKRGGDGGGAPPEDGVDGEAEKSGAPRQLASLGIALIIAVAVFAGLTLCETGAIHGIAPFGLSCARGSQIAANLSIAAGVGFLVFLFVEVAGMVIAQLFQDRRNEAAQRRADAAQRRADAAERKAEIAALSYRLDAAEEARRADAAEQARRIEVAEEARRADAAEHARRIEVAEEARRADAAKLSRRADAAERRAEVAELSRRADAAERRREAAEQALRAESERAARLELELELARRKNGGGENG